MSGGSASTPADASAAAGDALAGPPIYYFAIGSMVNPLSLRERNLSPLESYPGEVLDWRLSFTLGPMGMAEAIAEPGSSFHGVLHLMTHADMAVLDKIEAGYDRLPARVRKYSGEVVDASVYVRKSGDRGWASSSTAAPMPTQRYIELIIAGCRHFGVAESHLEYVRSVPCTPRKAPAEFAAVPVPPEGVPTWTEAEFAERSARPWDASERPPFLVAINGKAVLVDGLEPPPPAMSMKAMARQRMLGKHIELMTSKMLFDIKYGSPATLDEFTREHAAYLEDMFASNKDLVLTCVALLPQKYRDDAPPAPSTA